MSDIHTSPVQSDSISDLIICAQLLQYRQHVCQASSRSLAPILTLPSHCILSLSALYSAHMRENTRRATDLKQSSSLKGICMRCAEEAFSERAMFRLPRLFKGMRQTALECFGAVRSESSTFALLLPARRSRQLRASIWPRNECQQQATCVQQNARVTSSAKPHGLPPQSAVTALELLE